MATIPDTAEAGHQLGELPGDNYLTYPRGLLSWVFTLDHKRIGVMFLGMVVTAILLGATFALLIRTEKAFPGAQIMTAETYNRVFTLHGAVMIFLFVLPGIPSAFGNFVLPLMLGAKDVAFPRLNLLSLYLFVIGLIFFLAVLVMGGINTGWTFYAPLSVESYTPVSLAVMGAFILGFSSIFSAINFIVTTHTMRPAGMGWFKLPLFIWSIYATAIIQILATPVLAITLLLLIAERAFGIGVFDPRLDGDPILFQHFFWFYSHPAVYIMILPAMGVISEVIAVFARKHIFGYKFIAYSSIAIALLGFLVWGHHMFTSGQSPLVSMIFSGLTFLVAIPSAIKVFNWLATLYKADIHLKTPLCYAFLFIVLFGIGGLTGLFLGTLATDIILHDTTFVVAHFHYTMAGGVLTAFMAAIHYWWPKITGKMYKERLGQFTCLLICIGFNLTYLPLFVAGSRGMPRRYFDYKPEFAHLQFISSVGGFLLVTGIVFTFVYLFHSLRTGRRAPANPWGAATMEWQTSSPPPYDNFKKTPEVLSPYDYSRLTYDEKIDGYQIKGGA